jgi:hypothetical protein
MEKKHFVVPAGGSAKKYVITFAIALVVAAVVIAIFSLVTNRNTETWLSGDSGAAREDMFPFVFTSGNSLRDISLGHPGRLPILHLCPL